MSVREKKRLGDILVEDGRITRTDLANVLFEQQKTGRRLGEILIDKKILNEDELINVLETQLGIERVHMELLNADKKVLKLVPESIANKYNLIPVGIENNKIRVCMSDPLNMFAIDDIKIATGYEVEPLLDTRESIKKAIDKYYSRVIVKRAADELSKEQIAKTDEPAHDEDIDNIKNAPAVRLVESIIDNAVKMRASDIHIEPFEKYIKIRYRIDGELQEVLKSQKDTQAAIVTRIKILGNMDIAEKRLPQDGRILKKVDGREVDLRVSTLPTVFGEKVVIRILRREGLVINKDMLGISAYDYERIKSIIKVPHGMVLVTGPTGSGKSTTLYALLNDLNDNSKNIVTVEDPVEYLIEGINQVNVNNKSGLTFSSGLRSILRQDPDIVMIGEIRDSDTAEIAVRAAITGHVVLSTIHTNDAPSAVVRLIDMGIEPYLVATSVTGVISQRLVRKICPYCMEEYEAGTYEKGILGMSNDESVVLKRGNGCPQCSNTGYMGRTGVFEIMEITREHREMILNSRSTDELRDLSIRKGMSTLKMSCAKLVLEGTTTIDELVRVAFTKA